MGVTGREILTALVAGQEDPEYLAQLARGKLIKKQEQLKAALAGKLTSHHRVLLQELLQLSTTLDRSIARFDREIAERLRPHDALIERIDAVTGLARRSIEVLLGELGWDMSHFPDAAHAASWVGICPGNHETGGKRLSGRIREAQSLGQNGPYPSSPCSGAYPELSGRTIPSGKSRDVGPSELLWLSVTVFWSFSRPLVKTGESYHEKGVDYFPAVEKQKIQQRLVRQLERLGNTVILQPKAETDLT